MCHRRESKTPDREERLRTEEGLGSVGRIILMHLDVQSCQRPHHIISHHCRVVSFQDSEQHGPKIRVSRQIWKILYHWYVDWSRNQHCSFRSTFESSTCVSRHRPELVCTMRSIYICFNREKAARGRMIAPFWLCLLWCSVQIWCLCRSDQKSSLVRFNGSHHGRASATGLSSSAVVKS